MTKHGTHSGKSKAEKSKAETSHDHLNVPAPSSRVLVCLDVLVAIMAVALPVLQAIAGRRRDLGQGRV